MLAAHKAPVAPTHHQPRRPKPKARERCAGRLIDKLFERFGQHLEAAGYIARGGQIIDATIVSVPKQRNTKEENEAIKAGKTPAEWRRSPAN